ncbi:DNA cytosine methyltransferase [Terrisporobacter petrolearius]|uniref:DNA cytosine methyltransferase n=1 Tax=Terrisporobacter petrolearius TaxID=1460447 RepID=UPI0008E2F8C0|nr:DNA cytosine methyltransferase [Terrisporobacter petrolearius]MCC3865932.1 DNA cytosine methyltransferase [Terrisporobacter petrolearius]SFJ51906.1 DNA (cytosine-5)-methyltransferase 1 [Terrisporobacter glycolicus]
MKKDSYSVVSLFSGCGGFDLGLKESGFNIIWANDFDKSAVEIYRHNIGNIIQGDIREIDEKQIPNSDVIVAGFPCQPFSSAGNRLGINDERGNLYLECLRIINEKKPKVVIFENVRGILTSKNDDGSLLIDSINSMLEDIKPGYTVKHKLVKASDYGVPQNRYRVIFVAFRNDLGIEYEFPEPTHNIDDKLLTVGEVIKINSDVKNQDEVWEFSPQSKLLIPFIKEGGSWKDIPYEHLPQRLKNIRDNMKKYRAPNFYRRFARNEINGTITAAATPEKCGIIHPTEDRRYSVREVARIQSFPDEFEFIGDSIPNKYKVIGNAVPPLLGKVIGNSIRQKLDNVGTKKREEQLSFDIKI